ncbi:MAG: polyprenyl synthetase family protein [Candidatus Kryptoniota bacterium]
MKDFTDYLSKRRAQIELTIENSMALIENSPLRDGVRYVLSLGGKRIRPLIAVLSAEAVGRLNDDVLYAAAAIEVLHNFTLVHDDIMDNSETRRGKETVHVLFGQSVAILVGDIMMALAYDIMSGCSEDKLKSALRIFNKAVADVCNGQALDENHSKVDGATLARYEEMICKKTGALLKASGQLGALLGGGNEHQVEIFGKFGRNLGIAFQILDDILDIEGDQTKFGKPRGLDIVEKKKNYLYLKARELTERKVFDLIDAIYSKSKVSSDDIAFVSRVYEENGVIMAGHAEVENYTREAIDALSEIPESQAKEAIIELARLLVLRKF